MGLYSHNASEMPSCLIALGFICSYIKTQVFHKRKRFIKTEIDYKF